MKSSLAECAESLTIQTESDLAKATDAIGSVKAYSKQVESFFAESKKRAYDLWKGIVAQEKSYLEPVAEYEAVLKDKVLNCGLVTKHITVIRKFKVVITNKEQFISSLTPAQMLQFLSVDAKELDSFVNRTAGAIQFPGMEIVNDEIVRYNP